MISKKPFAGAVASIIFALLGMLLIQIDTAPDAPRGILLWLFRIVGYFLLFVAFGSFIAALYTLKKNNRA